MEELGTAPSRTAPAPEPTTAPVLAVGTTGPGTTNAGRRLPHLVPLDGLRGIAILLVVGVHSGNALWPEAQAWLAPGGPLGVDLFFVLSGFLITALLLGEHERRGGIDLRAFAGRRVRRLLPVVVALMAVLVVFSATGDRLVLKGVLAAAAYAVTFTTNLFQVHGDAPPVEWAFGGVGERGLVTEVSHLWSVGIEAQFYLVWGLILWAVTRARWSHGRIALLALGLAVAVAVWRSYRALGGEQVLWLYLAPSARLDAPLIGSALGVAWCAGWLDRVRRADAVRVGTVALLAFLVAGWVVRVGSRPLYTHGLYTALALVAALALLGALRAPAGHPLARALSWHPLVYLGTISYSVYVWHYGIFAAVERNGADWWGGGATRLAAGWALSLAASVASYHLVERRFLRRPSAPSEEAAPAAARTLAGTPTPAPAPASAPT